MLASSVILPLRASMAMRVILREPERSDRRPKDRFRAKAVNCLGWTAILRSRDAARPLPQDDRRGRDDRRGQDDRLGR